MLTGAHASRSLWQELLSSWERLTSAAGCVPAPGEPLVVKIQDPIAFSPSLDWLKKSALSEPLLPKRHGRRGIEFYGPHANPSAISALELLLEARDNPQRYAALAMGTCFLDLTLRFPAHWRGQHNVDYLGNCLNSCLDASKGPDSPKYIWNQTKKVYPEGFFSPLMLESIHWLDADTLARLAFANLMYYSASYLPAFFCFSEEVQRRIDGRFEWISRQIDSAICVPDEQENKSRKESLVRYVQKGKVRSRQYIRLRGKDEHKDYAEGARHERTGVRVERNRAAREACIRHYGTKCTVCGMEFGEKYGAQFEGIIEVHHIKPVSETAEEYYVDPVHDLRPLCPNCHRMIHAKVGGVYSIEELREIIMGSER